MTAPRRPPAQQQRRRPRATTSLLVVAVAALLLLLLLGGASARRAGGGFGGSSFGRTKAAPVSSGYSYRPTFTPAAAGPKTGTTAPRPGGGGGGGGGSSVAGMSGAATAANLAARRPMPLIVPFALGAGGGLLVSSALRSGQRCGDGRLECYREPCAQAQGQCAPAAGAALARAPCPAGGAFAECWAAGGSAGQAPDFVCNGKANPSGPSDVQAACLTPDEAGGSGGTTRNGGGGGGGGGRVAGGGALAAVLSAAAVVVAGGVLLA
jgi:hypothetical protein